MIRYWRDQASLSGGTIFFFMRSTSSPWTSSTHHVQAASVPRNERSTEGGILLLSPRSLPRRYAAILNLYVSRKLSSVPLVPSNLAFSSSMRCMLASCVMVPSDRVARTVPVIPFLAPCVILTVALRRNCSFCPRVSCGACVSLSARSAGKARTNRTSLLVMVDDAITGQALWRHILSFAIFTIRFRAGRGVRDQRQLL